MKLAVFNGSPRGRNSNTNLLMESFLTGFGGQAPKQVFIYSSSDEDLVEVFSESEAVILAFPLYTDAVPGKVKYFLELLKDLDWKGKRIGIIVQSGFPEAKQSSFIAEYLERLAEKKGATCIGSVIKGGIEGIQIQPERWSADIKERFRALGASFRVTGEFNNDIMNALRNPWTLSPTRRFIYRIMSLLGIANFYWNYNLKKNKAYKQRFDRPYATLLLILPLLVVLAGCSTIRVESRTLGPDDQVRMAQFDSLRGCENILLLEESPLFYVTDLAGYIHCIRENPDGTFELMQSEKIDHFSLGIDEGPDGYIYTASSGEQWLGEGGCVVRIDRGMDRFDTLSRNYPGINGLAMDGDGTIYFAVGNMKFFRPRGGIYRMKRLEGNRYTDPEILIGNLRSPNGLTYDGNRNALICTETFHGVKLIDLSTLEVIPVRGRRDSSRVSMMCAGTAGGITG